MAGSSPPSWMPYVAAGIGAAAAAMWMGYDQMVTAAVGAVVGGGGGYFLHQQFTPDMAYSVGAGGAALLGSKFLGWGKQVQIVAGAAGTAGTYYYMSHSMQQIS